MPANQAVEIKCFVRLFEVNAKFYQITIMQFRSPPIRWLFSFIAIKLIKLFFCFFPLFFRDTSRVISSRTVINKEKIPDVPKE